MCVRNIAEKIISFVRSKMYRYIHYYREIKTRFLKCKKITLPCSIIHQAKVLQFPEKW